jgi:hypothetical protein
MEHPFTGSHVMMRGTLQRCAAPDRCRFLKNLMQSRQRLQ